LLPLGLNLIYHKKWKLVFGWHWLLVFIIIALLLFPMSYGLYMQYDYKQKKSLTVKKVKVVCISIIGCRVLAELQEKTLGTTELLFTFF